ncbi:nicotinate-nucleotide--dimethylbenzimidazole phosphoribosyltransferase [Thiomicrorhabdus cannonii]|uniref:nicotinate-nucleotide--dimethylbenzimidazole phosphoribosyltransferase n=1 Tax=Thiomicrorhabdus cannonii TaxID=2748011 RepID=UPI0015B8EF43|nr:nicotinate-nucleotide--dimethylbenzimidazole phosphoribosyltransferase [Thiomicrorhabdus cannonii]
MKSLCQTSLQTAAARQAMLTKPAGSLGRLEELAIWLAGCQGEVCPEIKLPWISVFAADHGVTAEGVSAFPAVVTQEMVKNFAAGGAAITVLARENGAQFEVVDVGVFNDVTADLGPLPNLVSVRVASGSANFMQQAAMTESELQAALQAGEAAVERALAAGADLFIGGEMGIGNTTAAAAIISQLCDVPIETVVGHGTGINDKQKQHKAKVIQTALDLHRHAMTDAMGVLRHVGGLEIAALTGAYLHGARHGLPMVIDGVISCAAALLACKVAPQAKEWMVFGHQSVEPAQQAVFADLGVAPLIDLQMRLGEGSGAALAIPLIKLACALHAQMATFEQAGVSGAD